MRIGIDIGGTKIHAVAVATDGSIAHAVRIPTGFGPSEVVASTVAALEQLAAASGVSIDAVTSIGVGVPGAVEPGSGRVLHALNLGLDDLDLGGQLAERTGRRVRIENDVNAAALGAHHGLGGSASSMAYLNLGTGLAAGLVLDGSLWRGSRGVAGEIGHIPIDPSGPLCSCGQRGCLETLASGSAIARLWPSDDGRPVNALYAAAVSGDPIAIAVRERLAESVAAAVRMLVLTVDVETVVIGGGLSTVGEELAVDVRGVLAGWSASSAFLAMLGLHTRVELVPPDFPAAAVGAALIGDGERSASPDDGPALLIGGGD